MESVSVLMVYSELQTFARGGVSRRPVNPSSPYVNAAVSMIKERHTNNPQFQFFEEDRGMYRGVGSSLSGWTCAMREAIAAAIAGVESSITDRQLHIFVGPIEELEGKGDITPQIIQDIVTSTDEGFISLPVRLLWYNILKLFRKTTTNISASAFAFFVLKIGAEL